MSTKRQKSIYERKEEINAEEQMTDAEVDEMVNNWDKVTCPICHKEISMMNAKTDSYGRFICKGHRI